jgi:hypothetical protein
VSRKSRHPCRRNASNVGWIKRNRRGSDIVRSGHARFGHVGSSPSGFEPTYEGIASPVDACGSGVAFLHRVAIYRIGSG